MKRKPIDDDIVRVGLGPEHACCKEGGCELLSVCIGAKARPVGGERPQDWEPGGLMIIGEGPGQTEITYQRPFVGESGRLLDRILQGAGIDRAQCWVTNATLGYPRRRDVTPVKPKGNFSQRFPRAVYSCLPRLEKEIEQARPRVILTLGRAAFQALGGDEVAKTRLVERACDNARCRPSTRKVGPVIACANGQCDWYAIASTEIEQEGLAEIKKAKQAAAEAKKKYKSKIPPSWKLWGDTIKEDHDGECPMCSARLTRLRPKQMKCPDCGGRKRVAEEFFDFTDPFPLLGRYGVAGAVFNASDLPSRLDEYGVAYVIPTYHPSFCLRPASKGRKTIGGQFAARVLLEHAAKARRLLTEKPKWVDPTTLITDDPAVIKRWLSEPGRYAVDIETNSYGGPYKVSQITCVGFARSDRTEALVVDTRKLMLKMDKPVATYDKDGTRIPPDESVKYLYKKFLEMTEEDFDRANDVLDVFEDFFQREDVETVFHNGPYDRVCMHRLWDIWVWNQKIDTQFSHNALYVDEEHGLGFIAHELLDAPAWKDNAKTISSGRVSELSGYPDFDSLALYNARDTRGTAFIADVMHGLPGSKGRIHAEGVVKAVEVDMTNIEMGIRMQVNGMPVDRNRMKQLDETFQTQCDELVAQMKEITGRDDFNPNAKVQLREVLFGPTSLCKFEITKTTETGLASTAQGVLKPLKGLHPFVDVLAKWKTVSYLLSHYVRGAGIEPDAEGRIHPTWQPKLVTGRWSTTPNVQNWPKNYKNPLMDMRRIVVAPKGRKLIGADYGQLELRIMAALSGDMKLIELILKADETDKLNPDVDPHSYLAREVFGTAFTDAEPKDQKILRETIKRVWYGSLYGAGAQTIQNTVNDDPDYDGPPLKLAFVQNVLTTLDRVFSDVVLWKQRQAKQLYKLDEVRSPMIGRRRIFPLSDQTETTIAFNYPIQSGAADLMNWRMAILDEELALIDPTAFIIAQVHDAVYVECAEDKAEAVAKLIEETLTVRYAFPGCPEMLYEATADIGDAWNEC